MKTLTKGFVFVLLISSLAGCGKPEGVTTLSGSSDFQFKEAEHDFGVIKQSGGVVQHDFSFIYRGETPITVTSTPSSCACTRGEISITELQKGDTGTLTVFFNPNLHAEPPGRFYKTVSVITEPPLVFTPEVKIWQEIDLDLGEEAFELQNHDDDHSHADQDEEYKGEDISHDGSVPTETKNHFIITAVERSGQLAREVEYLYWTFDGVVPGTFLRVQEGENVTITFKNAEMNLFSHSIDLHAVHGPGGGAVDVPPGGEKTFSFKALNPGVYVYHCATPEVAEHIANGMYGLIVVEPKGGLPSVDREYYVMQGEIYSVLDRGQKGSTQLSGKKLNAEQPEYIVFNGRTGALMHERALTAQVGEAIRLFVGNGGVSKVSSFHVIGEVFDTVYPEGGTPVHHDIQTTTIPAGGATIVEFTVDVPGTYKLVDHALARLNKGAIAELKVTGAKNPEVFQFLD